MKFDNCDKMYNFLKEYICDDDNNDSFLRGAIVVGGYNEETFTRVLYYFTGWDSFEGYAEEYLED